MFGGLSYTSPKKKGGLEHNIPTKLIFLQVQTCKKLNTNFLQSQSFFYQMKLKLNFILKILQTHFQHFQTKS
jgi:hypothetical protein